MRKIGISTGLDRLNKKSFEEYNQCGIGAFELSVKLDQYAGLDIPGIADGARASGIETWSFHLPFSQEVNIASLDDRCRNETIALDEKYITAAGKAGFRYCVIHPSSEPIEDSDREESMRRSMEALSYLAGVAERASVTLAVEDLPRTCLARCSDEMLRLLSADQRLMVCFDTNHILMEDFSVFLDRVRDRLVTLHVSDYDYINERHWLPGEGKIDWPRLMDKLDEIGYDGVFMYEVDFDASRTIKRESKLTPAHFMVNARELHERAPLTKRGTPYENLGMWGVEEKAR